MIILMSYITYLIYSYSWDLQKQKERENIEYATTIQHVRKELKGRVVKYEKSRFINLRYIIDLSTSEKLNIYETPINYAYKDDQKFLMSFLQKGDSIIKPANSDSIFVFRNNRKYLWVFGERINVDVEKKN